MEQRVKSFKYSVKIESSYFAAGTKAIEFYQQAFGAKSDGCSTCQMDIPYMQRFRSAILY